MISVESCFYTECEPISYSITSFTDEKMTIQLAVDDPKQVSHKNVPEYLSITLLREYFAKQLAVEELEA